jgi:hypothetical protein
VPKELALEQCFGYRGAVDWDEWALTTLGKRVRPAREDFFAGAALAGQHQSDLLGGNRSKDLVRLFHRRRAHYRLE